MILEAGERIKNDIEVKASEKADAIIAKAKDQIEVERKNAIQDIRTSVIELSMQAAAKVIEKEERVQKVRQSAIQGIPFRGN